MSQELPTSRASVVRRAVEKVREINRRYATPRIKMSKAVKFSLLMLRLYLIFLVMLLVYRLITSGR